MASFLLFMVLKPIQIPLWTSLLKEHLICPDRFMPSEAALLEAAEEGELATARRCLKNGVSANCTDSIGFSPMHHAARKGQLSLIELLIEHKGDVSLSGWNGATPLHRAAQNGHFSVTVVLVANGADASAKNKDGLTPFDLCTTSSVNRAEALAAFEEAVRAGEEQWAKGAREREAQEARVKLAAQVEAGVTSEQLEDKLATYALSVKSEGRVKVVQKQYADFRALNEQLHHVFKTGHLPECPPKKLFAKLDAASAAQRTEALTDYLTQLLKWSHIRETDEVCTFLQIGNSLIANAGPSEAYAARTLKPRSSPM
jgi:hypothetical protein